MPADKMPASRDSASLPDATPLHRLIGRTRRLLRGSWVATGIGITLGLAVGALAVLAVLDLFVPLEPILLPLVGVVVPLDPILRCVALFLIVVPASLAFLQGVVRPLFRRLGPTLVARRIESYLPGIHNRLVSAIDLERADPATKPSPVFLRRLLTEALERVKNFRPTRILDYASLRRAALAAGVAALLAAGAWALFSDRLPTAVARIFNPFADIPPASGVAYAVEPGTSDQLRDEDITFTARVEKGQADALRLELYGARGSRKSYDLKQDRNDPAVFRFVMDGASLGKGYEDGFRYRVYGGRTWSRQQAITLVDRPVIANVTTQVVYPKYMKIPQPQPTPPQAVAVAGPEGTKADPSFVEVVVTSQHEVARGEVQLLEPSSAPIPLAKQQERGWFDEKLPTATTPGGNWGFSTLAGRKAHTEPASAGTYGHWFQGDPVGLAIHRGDVLFAHVYLPSDSVPESLMLEWHDGDGWEHRAYWGADKIREGKAGTASRFHAGPLPTPGKWVRLEVPASKVGLEGQLLRGVAFKMHGGQAFWGRTGTVQLEEPSFKVIRSFPMEKKGDDLWAGRFPLVGTGLFRAELKNPSGHPNKAMKELKYLSLPDLPPYVSLDRKHTETVLSKAAAVPLSIIAFDDYGLDEVRVLYRGATTEDPKSRSLWSAGQKPLRNLNLEATLDEAKGLKTGGVLHYLIEARDTRGQTARTQEFAVRVAADGATADKALAELDKVQDTFRDKLVKLLGDQKKVKEKLDELNKENAKLTEKLDKIREETPPPADPKAPPAPKTKPEDAKKPPQLTPEEQKRLAEIQKELAKLGADEQKNAQLADTLNKELKKNNEDAAKSDLVPKAVLEQMNATQNLFEKAVSDALKNLEKDIKDDAKSKTPDLKDLKDKSDAVDKNLDKVKDKLDALKDARKDLKDDLKKALDALKDKMAKADAKAMARDLEDLKAFLEKLRNQTREAREKNDENADATANEKGDPKENKKTREDIEKDLEKLLAKAKKLLDKKDKDAPEFPDAPFRDEKEEKVAPREADTDEPLPEKKGKDKAEVKDKDKGDPKDAKEDDEDEKKFMPRLGGKKEKIDPRYKGKQRPTKKKDKGDAAEKDDKDEDAAKQNQNSKDADSAEKALKADEKSLDDLLAELTSKAGKGKPKSGKQGDDESDAVADQLRAMMQSKSMREAMAMAAAAKSAQKGKPQANRPPAPPTQTDKGNLDGGEGPEGQGELGKLDPATRAMILKMPPSKYREELIRGLNEQGPEAYRAFIQNYFKQLTEKRSKK